MSAPAFPRMTCRKCDRLNPWVFFAPVNIDHKRASCICLGCAIANGWATPQGDLKQGVTL